MRPERSWLPAAISWAAFFTEALASRSWIITTESLSLKALNAWAICATSSLPLSGRRWERSLVPLAMLCIASRISDNRLSRRAIRMWTSAPLSRARITSESAEAFSSERMPEVASLLSSATTSIQFVPGTAVATRVLSPPSNVPSTGSPFFRVAKSVPVMVSANGFNVRAGSLAAITLPSLFRSNPLLAGVG